jgi:hypothetical protein
MKRVQDRINDAAGAWGKEWRGRRVAVASH